MGLILAIWDFFVFSIYRWLVMPVALVILRLSSPWLPAKMKEMLADRNNLNLQALPARPLWIHASSGEIEYAKSVIREAKQLYPQIPILVTYFSPSAKKLIQKFSGIDLAMALPWDHRKSVAKFLDYYKPRAFLIARTDVWPEIATEAKARGIPGLLFAATVSGGSSRKGFISGALTRTALNALNQIYCVSVEDQENILELGVRTPTAIAGDTRFDQVIHRLHNPSPHRTELRPLNKKGKIFVMGSTWPQDEEILLPALKKWIGLGHQAIIAPHEIGDTRLDNLEKQIEKIIGRRPDRYSKINTWTSPVLLVDQIGCLQELYAWGDVGFVGGSFKDKVHSVMEPLCVGLPVLVGPHHANNREALQFQNVILSPGIFAVNVVQNSAEIEKLLYQILELETPHPAVLKKTSEASQATGKIMSWLSQNL